MRKWTIWRMAAAMGVICSVYAPQFATAQGSGSVGLRAPAASDTREPAASPQTNVTSVMLHEAAQSGDWLMYGHNYTNNRYSPLKQINTTNVANLVPRMVFQTGTERLGSLETTPVVVNGIMYITSPAIPNNVVVAVDLRTQKLWGIGAKSALLARAALGEVQSRSR